jgi:hypothetical protein
MGVWKDCLLLHEIIEKLQQTRIMLVRLALLSTLALPGLIRNLSPGQKLSMSRPYQSFST